MSARLTLLLAATLSLGAPAAPGPRQPASDDVAWQAFFAAAGTDRREAETALKAIAAGWRNGYAAPIVDIARFLPSPAPSGPELDRPMRDDGSAEALPPGAPASRDLPQSAQQRQGADVRRRLTGFLERQTGQRFGNDLRAWRRWMWRLPYVPHRDYASFKAELYGRIDPGFRLFFPPAVKATIRLDEVDWGGVRVNGIPPLRAPRSIPAADATWLRENHIVFGVAVNGEARAYPKRILAWHELATDRIGGVDLTIVYCTLCGTVIPYESVVGGRRFTFGTSGLLYRSNKLMFDEETRSLWSSLEGGPVVGSLAGSGLRLAFRSVVTTTWGEWKRDYPSTTVLSLETGFERNYGEGEAYREYFSTDRTMFEVPVSDSRLKNKAEVLVLRPEIVGPGAPPVAISVDRLEREPVFMFEAGGRSLVVFSSRGGANRVYERGSVSFVPIGSGGEIRDTNGRRWTATGEALVSQDGERLARVPAHRAFWFGWVAQHPNTVLIR